MHLRQECISAIKSAQKDHNSEFVALQDKERECAEEDNKSPSDAIYTPLLEARHSLSTRLLAQTEVGRKAESLSLKVTRMVLWAGGATW